MSNIMYKNNATNLLSYIISNQEDKIHKPSCHYHETIDLVSVYNKT